MKTMSVTEFKAKCLQLINQLSKTGETIRLTNRGKPVAEIGPAKCEHGKIRMGLFRNDGIIVGDIISPLDTDDWEALK